MNALIINIIVIFVLFLLLYISFQAGIVRTLFAVSAGFFAVILAENYPYQYGINYYLIFVITALVIFLFENDCSQTLLKKAYNLSKSGEQVFLYYLCYIDTIRISRRCSI